MTAKDGAEKSAGQRPVDFAALADAVSAAAERSRAAAPPADLVAEALARRAGGEAFTAIGRDLAPRLRLGAQQAAKAVSAWCRMAAEMDPGYDAGNAPQRAAKGAGKSRPVAVRLMPSDYERLIEVAEGMAVSAVVERAVRAYLRRAAPGHDEVMTARRRRLLQDELSRVADELSAIRVQEAGIAKNFNQQTKFLNTYKELPVAHAREVARVNDVRESLIGELVEIRRSVDRLAEAG